VRDLQVHVKCLLFYLIFVGFVFDIIVCVCVFFFFRSHGGHVKTKGIVYLSNIRMVFVAKSPVGQFGAFDMPLVCVTPYAVLDC